jgi:ATP-dependent DNA helicase RecG
LVELLKMGRYPMTDADKINILIKEGEGLTVEFKEIYTPKIGRDIVAFANSKGGLLLLGVDDAGRVVGEKLTNLSSFLTSLSIYRKGKINNAGALMFASKVEKYVPHAESIFASFKGTDKTNIYDRNDVRDDLLTQFSESVAFFKKHLNIRSEIRGFDRFDIYEIPLDALREAVVNSIIHRDYAMKGTSIYVRIYDDRVEIENPGGLPDGITRRDFDKSSVRRNPVIADMFHRMGKVERMGSGKGGHWEIVNV